MSDEVQFKILEEGTEGEPCKGCGEVHDTISLKDEVKKQVRWFRVMTAGYIASLLAFAGCLYMLAGIWATLAFIAAFGAYFFNGNMGMVARILSGLDQAAAHFGEQQAAQKEVGEPEEGGMYL